MEFHYDGKKYPPDLRLLWRLGRAPGFAMELRKLPAHGIVIWHGL